MAEDAQECVSGTIESLLFRNEETGFSVLKIALEPSANDPYRLSRKAQEIVVRGVCAAAWLGESIKAVGVWIDDPNRGRQFKASEITCITPTSEDGIRRFLASGAVKGIGKVLANRIVDAFGENTIDILDHHSGRLAEIPKLGKKKIAAIRESWKDQRETRELMIFMQAHGIGASRAAAIKKVYGSNAVAVIKSDPYRLCRDVRGIGFLTADAIALKSGISRDSPLRARAALYHMLKTEADDGGHCWTGVPELLLASQLKIGVAMESLVAALKDEVASGRFVLEGPVIIKAPSADLDGGAEKQVEEMQKVWLRDLYFAELAVSRKLLKLMSSPRSFQTIDPDKAIDWWQRKTSFTLGSAQHIAVRDALRSKVFVITGGPGVGKTTIIKALVDIYGARKGENKISVSLAAPTGRAAKRMSEATGLPAQTLHRLLKYNPITGDFTYCESNPLEGDVFIFDETSMIDIRLMKDIIQALPDSATLILVGDTDQLPSVGPGSVLGDIIKSRVVNVAQLTEIYRQDATGLIVKNAHHVNAGEMFESPSEQNSDFYFIARDDQREVLRLALDFMVSRIPAKFRMEALQDIQILTPMRKNLLGADELNIAIQKALNPDGAEIKRGFGSFRAGDRVMQLRNNYDKDVYNGDIGFIKAVNAAERSMVVLFDGRPVVYSSGDFDELALAYATTIHKSQGSEYPAVIVLLHNQHYMMLQRNLLYTAITRGKKLVLVIGSRWAVKKAIETNTVLMRRTALADRLAQGRAFAVR